MARLIIMGPPGSGKGTQAEHIAKHFSVPAISTGDLFRAHVRDGTSLGAEAGRYMDRGEFVPDHVTTAMLSQRLEDDDAGAGFLLDGYPRTVAQVESLDALLGTRHQALEAVLALTVSDDELLERMLLRAKEQGRSDDTGPVIKRRLELYREQTRPVISAYEQRGILLTVEGSGQREMITAAAIAAVESVIRH
ncbi:MULTISPECIES: adenylate kinase [Paenarthrobacter]|uniref:adenylate kinase n=1 Tax=Paenarthrobacter TaxID=1742992 RepID=UPI00187861FB|nr:MULTISPECIES: adenylate kinase [Paenarthrobacter]QOT18911.1 adenylate kinase [Paenarthrobacter sp. YJN-5]UOD83293.1 adenylate kinase [Paenarthrobacter ureafaciens]WNZ06044.1 adenylate kinase [Paenarthrobacter ureafaciens]